MARSNPYYSGPKTDHFDGLRFFNSAEANTDKGLRDIVRWRCSAPNNPWPKHIDVIPVVPERRADPLTVTMVGHSTVLIQIAGFNLLTDPVWSNRASPFQFAGPRRVAEPGIRFADLPPIDAILLSHNHYDHLDIPTLGKLHTHHAPLIVTPLGNDAIVHRHIPNARIKTGDGGDVFSIGERLDIHIVPANHWSARRLGDRRMALWGGFMLRASETLIYFAGDTGYGTGAIFRNMRQQFGSPDLAILPIGAYDPRWFMAAQHVNPREAVQILSDLEARKALGMHWGVFKLTDETRDDPANRLAANLKASGIPLNRFEAMAPGSVARMT